MPTLTARPAASPRAAAAPAGEAGGGGAAGASSTPVPTGAPDATLAERALARWCVLFGATCVGAGHGLFLVAALWKLYGWPNLREAGGPRTVGAVLWFAACVPLALGALALRRRLLRWQGLRAAAWLVAGVTAAAYALYLYKVLRG